MGCKFSAPSYGTQIGPFKDRKGSSPRAHQPAAKLFGSAPRLEAEEASQLRELDRELPGQAPPESSPGVAWASLIPKEWRGPGCKIAKMDERGVTPRQIQELCDFLQEVSREHQFPEMRKIDRVTLRALCDHIVEPLTAHAQCSWVELVAAAPQPPQFLLSFTQRLPVQDIAAVVEFHSKQRQHLKVSSYWLAPLAADPGKNGQGLLEQAELRFLGSPSYAGCLLLVDPASPSVCAFRDSWCMLDCSRCVEETQQEKNVSLDIGVRLPHGAVKFGDPRKGLLDLDASSVLQLQEGPEFTWRCSEPSAAWPTWLLREGASLLFEEAHLKLTTEQLQDLRSHLRLRFAPALAYGLSGGRPLCEADELLLKSLVAEFPEAMSVPIAFGETAAFRAAAWGCVEALQIFMDSGVELAAMMQHARQDQVKAIEVVRARGHEHILQLLGDDTVPENKEHHPDALKAVVLQDDIPWAMAVKLPPALMKAQRCIPRSFRDDPACNGITLEQLCQLGDLVQLVLDSTTQKAEDPFTRKPKQVIWDITDRRTLRNLQRPDVPFRLVVERTLEAQMAVEATRKEDADCCEEECLQLAKEWRWQLQQLEAVVVRANLYHLCELIVKPLTQRMRCSWVHMVAEKASEQEPTYFVSHWWGGLFKETLEKLRFHAEARGVQGAYWLCTFANNQHAFALEGRLEETPFSRVLQNPKCRGTVALVDQEAVIFRRIWCIFELHLSKQLKLQRRFSYDLAMWQPAGQLGHLCSSEGLNGMLCLLEGGAVLELDGLGQLQQRKGLHAPSSVAYEGSRIDVFEAATTEPRDRTIILRHIADCREGEAEPDQLHPKFADLNKQVRARFVGPGMISMIQEGKWADLRSLVKEAPQFVDQRDALGVTPMLLAVERKATDAVLVLLEARAIPNPRDHEGRTPLHVATASSNHEILELLLEARADPNPSDSEGRAPAHIAADCGHHQVLAMLLQARADPNLPDLNGKTPTHLAARSHNNEGLKMLLQARADPDLPDRFYTRTPTHWAVTCHNNTGLQILLEAGANPNPHDMEGDTPTDLADAEGRQILAAVRARHVSKDAAPQLFTKSTLAWREGAFD